MLEALCRRFGHESAVAAGSLVFLAFEQGLLKGEEPEAVATLQFDVAQFFSSYLNVSCILKLDDCEVVRLLGVAFDLSDAVDVLLCEQLLDFCRFHLMGDVVDIAKKLDWGFVFDRL